MCTWVMHKKNHSNPTNDWHMNAMTASQVSHSRLSTIQVANVLETALCTGPWSLSNMKLVVKRDMTTKLVVKRALKRYRKLRKGRCAFLVCTNNETQTKALWMWIHPTLWTIGNLSWCLHVLTIGNLSWCLHGLTASLFRLKHHDVRET